MNQYTPSKWKQERDAKKAERRQFIALVVFGVLAVGYFGAHYVAYLIAN